MIRLETSWWQWPVLIAVVVVLVNFYSALSVGFAFFWFQLHSGGRTCSSQLGSLFNSSDDIGSEHNVVETAATMAAILSSLQLCPRATIQQVDSSDGCVARTHESIEAAVLNLFQKVVLSPVRLTLSADSLLGGDSFEMRLFAQMVLIDRSHNRLHALPFNEQRNEHAHVSFR